MDSSDDEELMETFAYQMISLISHRRSIHLNVPKPVEWAHTVLPNFDEGRFLQMIRVDVREFNYILRLIKNDPIFGNRNSVPQMPVELQLKITLFRLGSCGDGASIRKIASIFGVGDGETVHVATRRVIKALLNLKQRFMCWPNDENRKKNYYTNYTNCFGYIDGTEIKLAEAPINGHELFYSRKKQYSIKMQLVCDCNMRIIQATVGYQGSVHDAKIFKLSPIPRRPQQYFSELQWIAGDSVYPLSKNLITPFRQNSNDLTKESRDKFNTYFSMYRVRVDNCFGKLKEKFGSLKELKFRLKTSDNHKECCEWILSCCILYNILHELNYPIEEIIDNEDVIKHQNLRRQTMYVTL